ncbi:MAG: hypothetical protein WC247_04205 [Porticoccaceae bacterium]|jgi:hypothetical protein
MNTVSIEGWRKPPGADKPVPIEILQFHISDECHLQLEQAEEKLQQTDEGEIFVDVDRDTLDLETSADCGDLKDCRLRVYLGPLDQRGQFHLVGYRVSDHSLVYSNAVMVDQLG